MPRSDRKLWIDSPRFGSMCEALLASGHAVRFHVRGLSMQPNLRDGDAVIVERVQQAELHRGDIVLSRDREGLRVHRLTSTNLPVGLVTRGDTGLANDPEPQELVGRVVAIERNGRQTPATGARQRILHASRILVRRLKLAAALRLRKAGSSSAFFGLLAVFALLGNAAPASAQADLAITSDTAAPAPIAAGDQITYTVVVINNGPNTATTPSVTMATPANTTFVSAGKSAGAGIWTCAGVAVGGTGTETCTRGANMINGSTTTFAFVVQVNAATANGTVIAQAVSISSTTADPTPGNNNATANVTVRTPDLSVSDTTAPNLVAALSDHVASTSILRNVVRLCVYIAGALILLDRLGIAIAPLLTVLGVGGLAISLALKDTLSNLFAGMQIVASRHVRVGDMIKLESGEEGIVTDIQWRVTTVRTPLNTLVVVPNARFAEAIVTNCSRPTPEVLVRVPFAVGHGNDLERVERLALESGRETLRASAAAAPDFEPFVRFADWNESSVGLILVLKVREPGLEAPIRLEAIKRLHKTLASEGVALPYPVRTVRWEGPARAPEEVPGKPPEPR